MIIIFVIVMIQIISITNELSVEPVRGGEWQISRQRARWLHWKMILFSKRQNSDKRLWHGGTTAFSAVNKMWSFWVGWGLSSRGGVTFPSCRAPPGSLSWPPPPSPAPPTPPPCSQQPSFYSAGTMIFLHRQVPLFKIQKICDLTNLFTFDE